MSPAALSVVVRLFDGEERNKALGIWSSLGGVGAAVGVLLGGVLTAGPGWEWVFFVNVPVGVVLLVGLHRLLPPLPAWGAGARLDVVGATLVTAATLLVIYAFIGAGERGWGSGTTLGLLAAGVADVRRPGRLAVAHLVAPGRPAAADPPPGAWPAPSCCS